MHVPPRIFRRVPYETAVRFEFDRFRGFVEEHSADLSLGGMFVKTRTAPPVGTVVPIEFRLDDGYELIRGTGKVIWVREEDEGPNRPAGMGLRFLELTAGSRELIFKVVERRVKEGEPTFDLEDTSEIAAACAVDEGDEPAVENPGGLARPRWTAPPTLEGTDPGEPAVAAGTTGAAAATAATSDVAEEPAVEEGRPGEPPGPPPAPAEPAAKPPDPWEIATPWSGSPTGPRWVATDAPSAAGDPGTGEPGSKLDAELIFVPPDPTVPRGTPSGTSPPSDAGSAAPRRPPRIGRRLAAALLLAAALGAGAYLARDRWPGADAAAEAGEGGPGSHVLLRPEELAPPAGGRGPELTARPVEGEEVAADAAVGAGPSTAPDVPTAASGSVEPSSLAAGAPAAASPRPELAARTGAVPAGAPAPAAGPLARRVHDITWSESGGRTEFLIWADGALDPDAVSHFAIGGGNPRLVLRIPGIDEPFARGRVEVGGALVHRIRTGLHAERGSSEMHVVFDLTGGAVRLAGIAEIGGRLRVTLEGAGR